MNQAIRSVGAQPSAIFSCLGLKTSAVSLRTVTTSSRSPENPQSMDQKEINAEGKIGDVMSHSFGEGYSTRSDEEGFGGTNQSRAEIETGIEMDREIHENHPAYDKTQGSEVKEKEKARHQTDASN
ncbi:hypothetical protein DITRI_Ditri18aG0105600 [Diplodiscus trichospermus]